jgi:anti-sigma regulatory factor (Ser/Thr protein kinase)
MQRALLPTELPTLPGLTLAAHYQPAGLHSQAGGDWYDVIALDTDRVAIVMGDVVGAGASAAAIMGQLRGAMAALLLDSESCADALCRLSRVAARIPGATLSTAVILVLNAVTGELTWARAGHPPPLLLDPHDPERPTRYLTDAHGPSLGVIESLGTGVGAAAELAYRQARVVLGPGASVLLYTDGLVERRGRLIDEGLDRLHEALDAHAGAGAGELLTLATTAVPGAGRPHDDIALVVAQLAPDAPAVRIPAPLRLTLPALPEQLRPLRRAIAGWADRAQLSTELTGDLQLAVGEAAANAIEHAYPPQTPGEFSCVIEYTGDAHIRVEVRDHGTWRAPPANTGFRGRGLHFIRTIADDVVLQADPGGTTVIFTIAGAGPHRPIAT